MVDMKKRKRKTAMILCYILGTLCLVYFIGTAFFVRTGSNFYLIWGALAAGFLLFGALQRADLIQRLMPPFLRKLTAAVMLLCTLLFVVVECFVVSGFFQKGSAGLDYIIVLGAQVREDGPSRVLQLRLDKAYEYLRQNKDTTVIVSGGQGSNEPQSEAAGMKEYLMARGIAEERILTEDQSVNTFQNLTFSKRLLEGKEKRVGVVSNNFHIFRAVCIARKAGIEDVEGIAAPDYAALVPNNMLREFFGVMKDALCGNMSL